MDADLRDKSVQKSLAPELDEISDADLRAKVVAAYSLALSETNYKSLDEMLCSGMVTMQHVPWLTQAHHLRGVARISRLLAVEVRSLYNKDVDIDPDVALAAGLLHDLGKPFFYDGTRIQRWQAEKAYTGQPPFRHTFYGAHLALQVGLPIEIAHVIAGHDIGMEGQFMERSIYLDIVAHADSLYWQGASKLLALEKDETVADVPYFLP
jgi:putative nucleotidyltransferase with HDIG domain